MLWVKAFHIIAMVCWFAGLFYLPRLFVYHATANAETNNNISDEAANARFKTMERKLYRGITTPAMIATIGLGGWLLSYAPEAYLAAGWMHIKLTLVLVLVVYHLYCGKLVKLFAGDANTHSPVFYRWFNEFPVLILVGVVLLVTVKPGLS